MRRTEYGITHESLLEIDLAFLWILHSLQALRAWSKGNPDQWSPISDDDAYLLFDLKSEETYELFIIRGKTILYNKVDQKDLWC